jgi:hypothetical protein
MDIPAIYSVFKGGEVRSAPVMIDGKVITFESEPVRPAISSEGADDRMLALAVDVKGFGKEKMDDRFLMNIELRGFDVWFMTHIKDIEDVFDSFMGDIAKLLIPYHTTRNDMVLEEAFDMSDECIPVVFVSQGRAICREYQTKDIGEAAEELARMGFSEIAVFDTDSMLRKDDWTYLRERHTGLIPFVRKKDGMIEDIGFQKIISDL